MTSFLRRHWFALVLAGGMIAFEVLMALVLLFAQPAGQQWFGNMLVAPTDNAVYLAEIQEGSLFINNPFAVEPHAGRVDLVWSTLGLIHRVTGAHPLLLQELARWLFTIFLAFTIVAAARSVADNQETTRNASLLIIGGIGLGWVQALILALLHQWVPGTGAAPDLLRPFAIAPALLGGPHIILSLALLITAAQGIWKSVHDRTRATWGAALSSIALTFFHPFFIPLLIVITVMAWTKKLGRRPAHERTHKPALTFLLCVLPATAYYVWLLINDAVFSDLHVTRGAMPLPDMWSSLFALAPAAVAIGFLLFRHDREQRFLAVSRWCLAWLIAAFTLFALPVPWRGIFIQGLMVPLVLLSVPVWSGWLKRIPKPWTTVLLIFIVAVSPLTLLVTQSAWLTHSSTSPTFGTPSAVFRAWDVLKTKQHAVVIADDLSIGTWTPAWSGATSWIGHSNETPDYSLKRTDWEDLMKTKNVSTIRRTLAHAGATHLLFTSRDKAAQMASLLADTWAPIFQDGEVILLEKR